MNCIDWLNLHLSYTCNLDCKYCFLTKESRRTNDKFTRWDELIKFLSNAPLGKQLVINLSSGELSLFPELIEEAYHKIKKIERIRDTEIKFGLYTNGSNISPILEFLDMGILDIKYTSMSWDGVCNSKIRCGLNDEVFKNSIKLIGKSKYKNDFLIRSALTMELLNHLEETIQFLIDNHCSNWEYYFLIDNDEYRTEEFLSKFREQLKILYKHNGKGINIYNINSMPEAYKDKFKQKKLWCRSLYNSIDISLDGKVLPCGSYNKNYRYGSNNSDFDDISQPYNNDKIISLNKYNCLDCKICNYIDCKNLHCVECSRMISYRSGDTFEYKAAQPCKVRDIEREIYLMG